MHNREKTINFLGLIQRAGKLVSGTDMVISSIKARKVKLVIIASDLSQATRQEIGKARKVLAVSDLGFSKALQKKLNEGV